MKNSPVMASKKATAGSCQDPALQKKEIDMKRFFVFFAFFVVLAAMATSAFAGTYIVQKGDTLYGIAQKHGIKNWHILAQANQLANPNLILVGQKLELPSGVQVVAPQEQPGYWYWRNAGFAKYCGTPAAALDQFSIPAPVRTEFLALANAEAFTWVSVSVGEYFEEMVSGPPCNLKRRVVTAWKEGTAQAARVYQVEYQEKRSFLYRFLICSNWAWRWEEIPPPPPLEVEPPPEPIHPPEPVPPPIAPPPAECRKGCPVTTEVLANAGGYTNRHSGIDATGTYWFGLAEIRPNCWNFYTDGIRHEPGMHFSVFGAEGDSSGYNYDVTRYSLGGTLKSTGSTWENAFRLGYFWQDNQGEIDLFHQTQKDEGLYSSDYLSLVGRRNHGEKWFPKLLLGVEFLLPLNATQEGYWDGKRLPEDQWDNKDLSLKSEVSIYDFNLGNGWRLTPAVLFGWEHNWGPPSNYWTLGASMTPAWNGREFVQLSFSYKEELGNDGDFWQFGVFLNVLETYKVIKGLSIKSATADDLYR
jgi:hypothetical protein